MGKQLTVKEAKLVKGVAEGKPKYRAAIDAGYSPNSAPQIADETLKKPNVQEALQAELARQGITMEKIVRPVARALGDDSVELQLKGHDRAVKLLGLNQRQDNGTTVNVNFNQHVQDQREKYGL